MTPEQHEALRKPFPKSSVGKLPKGGAMLDYVGHAATTDRLLSVDPEWTWEPVAFDEQGFPAFQGRNLWIRLTVCGVTRYGVGDGSSVKECIGDAIRNAAMRFGVALDLWSKEELEHVPHEPNGEGGAPPPPPPAADAGDEKPMAAKTRAQMFALFGQKGVPEEAQLAGINSITGAAYESRGALSEAHARMVIDALKQRPDAVPAQGDPS